MYDHYMLHFDSSTTVKANLKFFISQQIISSVWCRKVHSLDVARGEIVPSLRALRTSIFLPLPKEVTNQRSRHAAATFSRWFALFVAAAHKHITQVGRFYILVKIKKHYVLRSKFNDIYEILVFRPYRLFKHHFPSQRS